MKPSLAAKQASAEVQEQKDKMGKKDSVLSCALLIAGTTIGGGFLALPRATAPCGFLPAVLGLSMSWLYLLVGALFVAESCIKTREQLMTGGEGDYDSVSIFRVANEAFGGSQVANAFVGICFAILILATMIAQFSKAGALISLQVTGMEQRIASLCFACFMGVLSFGFGNDLASKMNSALTVAMLSSFVALVSFASQIGSNARLLRADWSSLLSPSSFSVFLQLLVYTEVVPLVVNRLDGDRSNTRKAIVYGSILPLLMCVLWTMSILRVVPLAAAQTASFGDPVSVILASSGSSSHVLLMKQSVLVLAASAISTTVIGSLLTTTQFLQDAFATKRFLGKSIFIRALALLPPALVASFGGPSLYYACTAFAGSFPVTFLWGFFPPMVFLRLCCGNDKKDDKSASFSFSRTLSKYLAFAQILISLYLLACNTSQELMGFFVKRATV